MDLLTTSAKDIQPDILDLHQYYWGRIAKEKSRRKKALEHTPAVIEPEPPASPELEQPKAAPKSHIYKRINTGFTPFIFKASTPSVAQVVEPTPENILEFKPVKRTSPLSRVMRASSIPRDPTPEPDPVDEVAEPVVEEPEEPKPYVWDYDKLIDILDLMEAM